MAGLLDSQNLLIDLPRVDEVQELLLLLLELTQTRGMPGRLLRGVLHQGAGIALNFATDGVALGSRERHGVVVALDRPLDLVDRQMASLAMLAASRPADAPEVLVEASGAAADAAVDQTPAAVTAEDRALEMVVMLVGAIAAMSMSLEDLLNLPEYRPIDQGVMAPIEVLGLAPGHDADVVLAAQHVVHVRARQRRGGALRCRQRPQTSLIQQLAERGHTGQPQPAQPTNLSAAKTQVQTLYYSWLVDSRNTNLNTDIDSWLGDGLVTDTEATYLKMPKYYDAITCSQNPLTYDEYVFSDPTLQGQTATVTVSGTYMAGQSVAIPVQLVQLNGTWAVNAIICPNSDSGSS